MALTFGTFFLITVVISFSDTNRINSDSLFSQRNAKFATDFYSVLTQYSSGNFVFSPLSLQVCGALLYSGSARGTAEELVKGLSLIQNNRSKVVRDFYIAINNHNNYEFLKIVNKIYFAKNIQVKKQFHRIATKAFFSEEELVDFSNSEDTAGIINHWVRSATHNKINGLFNSRDFDSSVYMTLVNTIYFQGKWIVPFDVTLRRNFRNLHNHSREVDMMFQSDDYEFGYFPELDAKVIKLPYENTDISMLIILPNQDLRQLEHKLPRVDIVNLQNRLELSYVEIGLPKFHFDSTADLRAVFTRMGMSSIFINPDFSNMVENKSLKVDRAVHKAFISVTELGTEAGASTGFSMHFLTKPERFLADHPFIFTIVSKTAVLFMGRYVG